MSVDPSRGDSNDFSDVNPIASEALDSALEQLHLDDLDEAADSSSSHKPNAQIVGENYSNSFSSAPPSHMYPHPQMIGMGFIPFSQMIPVPHHTGFFPPPEFRDSTGIPMGPNTSGAILFNNSNDASMFTSSNSGPAAANDFSNTSLTDKTSAAVNPSDPLWYASDTQAQSAVDPVTSSSAIEDSNFLEDNLPQRAPGGAVRRQTFHAISANDLINSGVGNPTVSDPSASTIRIQGGTRSSLVGQSETLPANTTTTSGTVRTQSTSLGKGEGQIFDVTEFAQKKIVNVGSSGSNPLLKGKDSTTSPSYAAAYPYGGPLLQPNPVLSGHTPPGSQPAYGIPSPFHGAYGFASPFQFSPPINNPNSHMQQSNSSNPHNQIQAPLPRGPAVSSSAVSADANAKIGVESDEQSNLLPPHQSMQLNQQSGTPPPWMYGSHPFGMIPHHSVPQGHPHMLHSNSPHPNIVHGSQNNRRGNSHNGGNRAGKAGHYGNSRNKHNRNSQYNQNGTYNNERHKKNEDASRYAEASFGEFIGNLYTLCKDQHGCRFLQRQLDLLGPEAADAIFNETREYTVELMTDSFGNYLIQKLLEIVKVEQRIALTKIAAPHFMYIASNPHGTRALQKLVECIDTEEEAMVVVESLKGSIVELSKDLNGNHIVQKCLQKLPPKDIQFIFDAACVNCIDIATHRHGCCVLQRCLDHGSLEQRQVLCEKLLAHVDILTLDPFGNYVVQYIITKESENGKYNFTQKIVNLLTPKFTKLSLHKFGSNVIEKILRTPAVSEVVIMSFLDSKGESEIQALLNDSYGNYVLQTMLDVSKEKNEDNYRRLLEVVRPLLVGPIRNTPHGRRIMGILQIDQSPIV